MSETSPKFPSYLADPQEAAEQLAAQLHHLFPEPIPDVLTLADYKKRYPLTKLGDPANRAIAQSRRINQTIGDTDRRGLAAFHIGLIYLHEGDSRAARAEFAEACRQWQFADRPAALALACFAEGRAHEYGFQFETAVAAFDRARQWLHRAELAGAADQTPFSGVLQGWLESAQTDLRRQLWERENDPPAGPPAPRVAALAPNIGIQTATTEPETAAPVPGHQHVDEQYHWYRIEPAETAVLFPKLTSGDWLLACHNPSPAQIADGTRVLVHVDTDIINGMLVTAAEPASQSSHIYLGRLAHGYSPDPQEPGGVPVVLAPNAGPVHLSRQQILATVVGAWQPYLAS